MSNRNDNDPGTNERRADQRHRALKGAKIVSNDHRLVLSCTVRNISASGALIMISSPYLVPGEFELRLDDGNVRRCVAAWRKLDRIGVKFSPSDENNST